MKRTPSRQRPRKGVACPVCGNANHFAVYVATLKVHHMAQHAPGRWRRTSGEPKRHDRSLPLLLVCESCAYPLGAVPASVLKVLP
ncbi:MAG: hypothetical protein L6R28_18885 [Planctomycetes bacterium]|nr:hypothetical protein [Planctomycetota bacterium]